MRVKCTIQIKGWTADLWLILIIAHSMTFMQYKIDVQFQKKSNYCREISVEFPGVSSLVMLQELATIMMTIYFCCQNVACIQLVVLTFIVSTDPTFCTTVPTKTISIYIICLEILLSWLNYDCSCFLRFPYTFRCSCFLLMLA